MAGTNIAVPDALDKIVAYYDEQKHAMAAINHYVGTHCGLHNAMGFLLGYLQPLYDDSRDRMTTALDGLQSAVDGFSGQVVAYSRTWEELETNTATGIGVLDEELCVIGGGGNNGGSGGGGGYGGPPQVYQPPTAEPPVIEPPADETPIDETPVDEPAPDETPVEEPPVDDTPVDEIPVEETP
ncbi:MAG: hypothetical protein KF680_10010, partial [Cryobacterium sp.]|nr:hypothetical protein [Cryobacterium sp.]